MKCKKSKIDLAYMIFATIALGIMSVIMFFIDRNLAIFFVIITLFCAVCCFLQSMIIDKYNYLELTDTQVIGHSGILKTKTQYAPISKIQNIEIEGSILGAIFNCQTIVIYTAGTGSAEFRYKFMKDATAFVDAVQARLQ